MCKFLSSIYTRKGDLICDPANGDSHEDLIRTSGLRDSGREFVRLEFYPPRTEQLADLNAYVLHLDEESAPAWWDESAKEKAERKLRVRMKKIILTESRGKIQGGCAILGPGVAVGEARGTRIAYGAKGSSVVFIDEDGTKEWYKNDQRHREDGPARERADGTKEWWKNDQLHRNDGPAFERADGTKMWYKNGQRHRDGGPAIEWADGAKEWYKNGKLHREDGPAYEWADGTKMWYKNGQLHRDGGPAIERASGSKAWWKNGKCVTIKNSKRRKK